MPTSQRRSPKSKPRKSRTSTKKRRVARAPRMYRGDCTSAPESKALGNFFVLSLGFALLGWFQDKVFLSKDDIAKLDELDDDRAISIRAMDIQNEISQLAKRPDINMEVFEREARRIITTELTKATSPETVGFDELYWATVLPSTPNIDDIARYMEGKSI